MGVGEEGGCDGCHMHETGEKREARSKKWKPRTWAANSRLITTPEQRPRFSLSRLLAFRRPAAPFASAPPPPPPAQPPAATHRPRRATATDQAPDPGPIRRLHAPACRP